MSRKSELDEAEMLECLRRLEDSPVEATSVAWGADRDGSFEAVIRARPELRGRGVTRSAAFDAALTKGIFQRATAELFRSTVPKFDATEAHAQAVAVAIERARLGDQEAQRYCRFCHIDWNTN